MDEQKPTTSSEDVKYDVNFYPQEEEEQDGPPSLAPPAPISRCRLSNSNFIRKPAALINDRGLDSYDRYTNYSSVERYNEEVTMRFLFGNGKPLTTVDDEHFLKFLHHLNKVRPPPEAGNMATRAMSEQKPSIKYQPSFGPLCITLEAIRKNDEIYLAISVHFYSAHGERQNTVHFEKIIIADYEGRVVADRIRRVVDANKIQSYGVSYIQSPNVRMLSLVTSCMPPKEKFICFFCYITNIAREVIYYSEFSTSLKVLREYVEALHKRQESYARFRQIQIEKGSNVDIPALDSDTDWLSTLHFLSKCSSLNETYSNVGESWCMPNYLNENQENAIANLYDFLLALCQVASQICSEDSCVSQVLYSMSLINDAIENCKIKTARERMLRIFNKNYGIISNGSNGDFYSIATLLDPRYGYSSLIFNDDDWLNVENKLIREAEKQKHRRMNIQSEIRIFKELLKNLPEFDEITTHVTWWNDRQDELPIMYRFWIEYSTVPAVSIDAKRFFSKGGKFAHLFATLDEELQFKALLLAQSSQEYIGRGSNCLLVQNQIGNSANQFRRIQEVPDEGLSEVKREEPEQLPEQEVKLEEPDNFD
uniref:HAT C-terminal dimerisation domain-containing protein n=1 Tax=Caenorhabditis tropicalis TaxID=1561998 RepID=A0A1I7TFW9_9PELO